MDTNSTYVEKDWRQIYNNVTSNIEQALVTAPYKTTAVRPPTTHHKNYLLEKLGRTNKWYTPVDSFTWTSKGRTTN